MPTKVTAMAMDRKQFKSRVSEYLTGAIGEYLKSRLASEMGWPNSRYVGKWRRESDTLVNQLDRLIKNQPTTQKFDRTKVVRESLKDCTAKPLSWLVTTGRVVSRVADEENLPDKLPRTWGIGDIEDWLEEFSRSVTDLLV